MDEVLRGRIHKFGDFVECDSHIIPHQGTPDYSSVTQNIERLARLCFTPIDPDFPKRVRKGDFVVAGQGFGSGKTHELGIIALEACGIKAIIAESIQRAYFRFAINHGIVPIIYPGITEEVETGDLLEIIPQTGKITDLNTGRTFWADPLPELVQEILQARGILNIARQRLIEKSQQ